MERREKTDGKKEGGKERIQGWNEGRGRRKEGREEGWGEQLEEEKEMGKEERKGGDGGREERRKALCFREEVRPLLHTQEVFMETRQGLLCPNLLSGRLIAPWVPQLHGVALVHTQHQTT